VSLNWIHSVFKPKCPVSWNLIHCICIWTERLPWTSCGSLVSSHMVKLGAGNPLFYQISSSKGQNRIDFSSFVDEIFSYTCAMCSVNCTGIEWEMIDYILWRYRVVDDRYLLQLGVEWKMID
jgi:hypothetical protein